jgi:hypothetical protein
MKERFGGGDIPEKKSVKQRPKNVEKNVICPACRGAHTLDECKVVTEEMKE